MTMNAGTMEATEMNSGGNRNSTRAHRKITDADAQVASTLTELEDEHARLRMSLLDTAVAGATLARDPSSPELREEAARAWSAMDSIISHHLLSEDDVVIPWAEHQGNVPPRLLQRARERHERLRRLAKTLKKASFATDSEADVARAGKALLAFAVHLDDLIDGEERELFPILHRSVFSAVAGRKG
jgi:Hemerythrin HHE cation binding domain